LKLETVHLENFRSYKKLELAFSEGVNLISGKNGCGKTNILESIFFLATTRSHRTASTNELINWSADSFFIKTAAWKKGIKITVEMGFGRDGSRAIKINNQPTRARRDVIGTLPVVMFSPEDLLLIKEDPAQRRRFLDIFISQVSHRYLSCLQRYNRLLLERNMALVQAKKKGSAGTLDVWDESTAKTGYEIVLKRAELVNKLKEPASRAYADISGGQELKIKYVTSVETEEGFLKKLREKRKIEIELGITTTGPHRDDLHILSGGRNLRNYGSQGLQRAAAIALKLAQLRVMREELQENPVMLFDDVTSELDGEKKSYFLKMVSGGKEETPQSFITTAEPGDFMAAGGINFINL